MNYDLYMAQVNGKKIDFTEDDFYKTLREHDNAILKKFNDRDLNDEDYFFLGINSDIMSNALSIFINRLSGNSESIGIDNNCRAIIEAFVVLKMDASGEITPKQKELYRYQYALVDYDNFKKALTEQEKENDNYKKLNEDKEKAIQIAMEHFNCTRKEIGNYKFSADDPAFYLKKKLSDKISFAHLLSKHPIFDEKSIKIYEFFSLFAHPRFEMNPDAEKGYNEIRKTYVEKVLNYVFEYLADLKFLIKDDKLKTFNDDFWFNPKLANNVYNIRTLEQTFILLERLLCKFDNGWDAFTWFYLEKMRYLIIDMSINVSLGYNEQTCSKLKSFIEYSAIFNAVVKSESLEEFKNNKLGYWYSSKLQVEEYLDDLGLTDTTVLDKDLLKALFEVYYKDKYHVESYEEFEKKMRGNSLYFISDDEKKSYNTFCMTLIDDVFKSEEKNKFVKNIYRISKDMNHATGYNFNASEGIWFSAPHRALIVAYDILIYFILLTANALHENGIERDVSIPIAQLKLFLQQHYDAYIKFVKSEMN